MRRIIGSILTVAGAVALAFVGVSEGRAALARDRVRGEWAALEARALVEAVRGRNATEAPNRAVKGAAVGRLQIPGIGLDEVIVEGVGDLELAAGPGHLPGSVLPGERGNAIISAHRDRHFRDLDELRIGDTIVTQTRHKRTAWRVIARKVVAADSPALRSASEPQLTLTTCWPVRYLGPAPDRLLITAIENTEAVPAGR